MSPVARLFTLLALFPALAVAGEVAPPLGQPRDFGLPGRETIALDNGLQVTFIDYGIVPKVTVLAVVRTGNIDDGSSTWLVDLTKRNGDRVAGAGLDRTGERRGDRPRGHPEWSRQPEGEVRGEEVGHERDPILDGAERQILEQPIGVLGDVED